MTYYGVVLLVSGYQADEEHMIKQYQAIVNKVSERYPDGTLWILNKAKIQRMTKDGEGAIETLKRGLEPGREEIFPQADALLVFELAWALLGFRRYEECAETFLELIHMNSWSHATYCFIAAGCFVSAGMLDDAQEILDKLPESIDRRKRIVSSEVYIKKKVEFYQKKQIRRGGDPKRFVEAIKISPAEEFGIFWNTHAHIDKNTALAHIKELSELTPPVGFESEYMPAQPDPPADAILDLDTADELAVRALILGIVHRTIGDYTTSRKLLNDAVKHFANVEISSWVGAVAWFERSVLELKDGERVALEAEAQFYETEQTEEEELKAQEKIYKIWQRTFDLGRIALRKSHGLCTKDTDLAARLDSRIIMLKDEMKAKMAMLGMDD
jgi:tetratricopeptide (TPR) repeat protein